MKHKLLALILTAFIICGTVPSVLATQYIVYEDFSVDTSFFTVLGSGSNKTTVTKHTDGSNSYAKIQTNGTAALDYVDKQLEPTTPAINTTTGKVTFETRVKFSTPSYFQFAIFGKGVSGGYPAYINSSASNGLFTFSNGTSPAPTATYSIDSNPAAPDFSMGWQTLWVVVDFDAKTSTFYFNDSGTAVVYQTPTPIEKFHALRFSPQTGANASTTMYVDYVKIYYGAPVVPEPAKIPVLNFYNGMNTGDVLGKGATPMSMVGGGATADVIDHDIYGRTLKIKRSSTSGGNPQPSIAIPSWFRNEGGAVEYRALFDSSGSDSQMRILNTAANAETFVLQVRPSEGTFYINATPHTFSGYKDKWVDLKFVFRPDGISTLYDLYIDGALSVEGAVLAKPIAEFGHFRYTLMATSPVYVDYIAITPLDYPIVKQPTATPKTGRIEYAGTVTLASEDGDVYYTVNGSTPSVSSTRYTTPIMITENNQIIKAISVNADGTSAPIIFGPYTFDNYDGLVFQSMRFLKGGTEVTALSQLSGGDEITVEFSYFNVTALPISTTCVFAVQNGNVAKMAASASLSFESGLSTKSASFTLPSNIAQCTILAFIWNGIDTCKPYSDIIMLGTPTITAPKGDIGASIDVESHKITVTAVNTLGRYGTVRVKNISAMPNVLIDARQALVNSEGKFTVIFELDETSNSGEYEVVVGGTDMVNTTRYVLSYLNSTDLAALWQSINSASDVAALKQLIEANQKVLGLDTSEAYYATHTDKIIEFFARSIENVTLNKIKDMQNMLSRSILLSKIDDASSAIGEVVRASEGLLMAEGKYDLKNITSDFIDEFDRLSDVKAKPNTTEALMNWYYDIFILSRLNVYAKQAQTTNIVSLISTYNDVLKLDVSGKYKGNESTVAKIFLQQSYTDMSGVRADFNMAVNNIPEGGKKGDTGNNSTSPGKLVGDIKIGGTVIPEQNYGNIGNFDDLDGVIWAFEAINTLASKGVINGKSEREFLPNDRITRAEFVKIMLGALGVSVKDGNCNFADVEKAAWYYNYVVTVSEMGIVVGYDNIFGVNDFITRQDAAVMVSRAINKLDLTLEAKRDWITFSDISEISDYALSNIKTLYSAQIISGVGDNRFAPLENMTRAQAAVLLYNAAKGGNN